MEVLGREIEVAGAKLFNHPLDLVHARPPARHAAAAPVHDPLCPVRLIGVAQPAKVPLAHAQQGPCFNAAQLPRLMQPNHIDDPGHPDLRQHAIPPVKTGQIVCYETVADLVPPVAAETAGAIIGGGGGGRPVFGGPGPRYETWPRGCCGLECGDAPACRTIPFRKLMISRSPALQFDEEAPAMTSRKRSRPRRDMAPVHSHAAAVDIGATLHVAAVSPRCDPEPVRGFGAFTPHLPPPPGRLPPGPGEKGGVGAAR